MSALLKYRKALPQDIIILIKVSLAKLKCKL